MNVSSLDLEGGDKILRYARKQQVLPEQRVADREIRPSEAVGVVPTDRTAVEEETALADVAESPPEVFAVGDVVEGESSAAQSAGGRSVGVRRLHGLEDLAPAAEEAEEEWRVAGAVAAEEVGVGDEAPERDAGGGGAGEVGAAGNPEEDPPQQVVGEGGRLPRRCRGFGAGENRPSRRRHQRNGLGLPASDEERNGGEGSI